MRKMYESLNGLYATDEDANQFHGELWYIDGTFENVLDFLIEWELAPSDIISKSKIDVTLLNADAVPYAIYTKNDILEIYITSKELIREWKRNNPSDNKVEVLYGGKMRNTKSALKRIMMRI